jgi:uncharacterized protein
LCHHPWVRTRKPPNRHVSGLGSAAQPPPADSPSPGPAEGQSACSPSLSPSGTLSRASLARQALSTLTSSLLGRMQFAFRHGLSAFSSFRNLWQDLGYPLTLTPQDYRDRYDRGDIAARIVNAYPEATWSDDIAVYEDEDPNVETTFEGAVSALGSRLRLWDMFKRADILSLLGEYAVLWIGAPGDVGTELKRFSRPENVLFLRPLSQRDATVESYVLDPANPRCGQPEFYTVKVAAGTSNSTSIPHVHWSRIIPIVNNPLDSDIQGEPTLRSVWNRLMDLDKVVGAGSEAAYRRMDAGIHTDIPADREVSDEDITAIEDEVEDFRAGLTRSILTRGADVKVLNAGVMNFGPNAGALIDLVAGAKAIPKRKLLGSERGELASSQDAQDWNDRVVERQRSKEYEVRMFFDRMIYYGALPAPESGEYFVSWPSALTELSELQKVEAVDKLADANSKHSSATGGKIIVSADEIREMLLDLEPLEGNDPTHDPNPDPNADPNSDPASLRRVSAFRGAITSLGSSQLSLIHRAADRYAPEVATTMLSAWDSVLDLDIFTRRFETLIEGGKHTDATDLVLTELRAGLAIAERSIYGALFGVLAASAELSIKAAKGNAQNLFLSLDQITGLRGEGLRGEIGSPITSISLSFDLKNPRAIQWAAQRSSALITEITPTTEEAVRAIIARGLSEGIAPRALAKEIKSIVGLRSDQVRAVDNLRQRLSVASPGASVKAGSATIKIPKTGVSAEFIDRHTEKYSARLLKQRAELIARTETMRSANAGQVELWQQAIETGQLPSSGLERVWIATLDDRCREEHEHLNGEQTGIKEPFSSGYEPGEQPRCRCGQGLVEAGGKK